jgi:hypothetical protein
VVVRQSDVGRSPAEAGSGWYAEQRAKSDSIGYVLTRFSKSRDVFVLASRKVYHNLPEAAQAAVRADKNGLSIFVDMADKYGVAPKDTASARQPADKQKARTTAKPLTLQQIADSLAA